MWRMKALAISVVVLGALLFGAVVAYAGWSWNAKVDVGGTLISTAWEVDGANKYKADIKVTVPKKVDLSLVELAPRKIEKVTLSHSKKLKCKKGRIEATVSFEVKPDHSRDAGEGVTVSVSEVGGDLLGSGEGSLGDKITVKVLINGSC